MAFTSVQLWPDDVLFFQRFLATQGFYTAALDDDFGPKSRAAARAFHNQYIQLRYRYGISTKRSEIVLRTLTLETQETARRFLRRLRYESGMNVWLISGTRTYDEQNKLYAKGRYGNLGRIVTQARGGQSNHNFGIAFDVGIFDRKGVYLTADQLYIDASRYADPLPLRWGGNFSSFFDPSHYEMRGAPLKVAQMAHQFEQGQPLLT